MNVVYSESGSSPENYFSGPWDSGVCRDVQGAPAPVAQTAVWQSASNMSDALKVPSEVFFRPGASREKSKTHGSTCFISQG